MTARPSARLLQLLRQRVLWIGLLLLIGAAAALLWLRPLAALRSTPPAEAPTMSAPIRAASFVGSERCADCHQAENAAWQQSHHAKAMQHATPVSVLGDFSGAT